MNYAIRVNNVMDVCYLTEMLEKYICRHSPFRSQAFRTTVLLTCYKDLKCKSNDVSVFSHIPFKIKLDEGCKF